MGIDGIDLTFRQPGGATVFHDRQVYRGCHGNRFSGRTVPVGRRGIAQLSDRGEGDGRVDGVGTAVEDNRFVVSQSADIVRRRAAVVDGTRLDHGIADKSEVLVGVHVVVAQRVDVRAVCHAATDSARGDSRMPGGDPDRDRAVQTAVGSIGGFSSFGGLPGFSGLGSAMILPLTLTMTNVLDAGVLHANAHRVPGAIPSEQPWLPPLRHPPLLTWVGDN